MNLDWGVIILFAFALFAAVTTGEQVYRAQMDSVTAFCEAHPNETITGDLTVNCWEYNQIKEKEARA